MYAICYAALCAIHFAASGLAVHAGAMPDAACAGAAALVYATLALGARRRQEAEKREARREQPVGELAG